MKKWTFRIADKFRSYVGEASRITAKGTRNLKIIQSIAIQVPEDIKMVAMPPLPSIMQTITVIQSIAFMLSQSMEHENFDGKTTISFHG